MGRMIKLHHFAHSYRNHTTHDIVIIGSGAGARRLAYALANSGKDILILERGERIPQEHENWNAEAIFQEGRYGTDETWRDKEGECFPSSTMTASRRLAYRLRPPGTVLPAGRDAVPRPRRGRDRPDGAAARGRTFRTRRCARRPH